MIGGADVRHVPTEELMSKISMVFQKVYLFEDTILNNIRFGKPDATLEEVRAVAKAARCDDFIMALPNGYDTLVQEGGDNLSGGEKQRISIATAPAVSFWTAGTLRISRIDIALSLDTT